MAARPGCSTARLLLAVAAILLPWCCCFAASCLRPVTFGYRDAANFYYPLFSWQCTEWSAGRVPLWNPLDACGVPSLADTTSSALYPGKLVFALPLPFWLRYNLYVSGHVLLAAFSVAIVARCWRASVEGAACGALAYAFGGVVLFQYTNVVFLVGAAWLPLGLLAADRMFAKRSLRAAVGLGVVAALCTLGGDPQSAYHLGLAAILLGATRCPGQTGTSFAAARVPWKRRRPTLLAVAATCGFCLAAVQILPALAWSAQSVRRQWERPRNLYELGIAAIRGEASDAEPSPSPRGPLWSELADAPPPGTHHRRCYRYSVGPWRAVELMWPNCLGGVFPANRRWISALPAEGRVWTPSLYMGLLPLLVSVLGLRWVRGPTRTRWLSWMVGWFACAALGWYGLGWLVNELAAGSGLAVGPLLSPPLGGPYWFMNTLLPGYVYFRYPAKLLVMAMLGLSLLAAQRWELIVVRRPNSLIRPLLCMGLLTVVVLVASVVAHPDWEAWVRTAPADPVFGPVDLEGAHRDLRGGLLHALLIVCCLLAGVRYLNGRWRSVLLLLITASELTVANSGLVALVPVQLLEHPSGIESTLRNESGRGERVRISRDALRLPEHWRHGSSADRLGAVVAWERATLAHKHHLLAELALLEASPTLSAADTVVCLDTFRAANEADPAAASRLLDAFSLQYELVSQPAAAGVEPLAAAIRPRPAASARAWLVEHVEQLLPLDNVTPGRLRARTREVFFPDGKPRDLRTTAVVESKGALPWMPPAPAAAAADCRIDSDQAQKIVVHAHCPRPALLVLNDYYQKGWVAAISTSGSAPRPAEIHRTNRIMRGIFLPAGTHRVEMMYRPRTFWVGAALSALAWLLLFVVHLVFETRNCRERGRRRGRTGAGASL